VGAKQKRSPTGDFKEVLRVEQVKEVDPDEKKKRKRREEEEAAQSATAVRKAPATPPVPPSKPAAMPALEGTGISAPSTEQAALSEESAETVDRSISSRSPTRSAVPSETPAELVTPPAAPEEPPKTPPAALVQEKAAEELSQEDQMLRVALFESAKKTIAHSLATRPAAPPPAEEKPPKSVAPPPPPTPYAALSPQLFELYERMVGVMTVMDSSGVTETTVSLSSPQLAASVFNGAQIIIREYSTAPKAFNVQLAGSPEAVNLFQSNIDKLTAAFETGQYNFQIHRLETVLQTATPPRTEKRKKGSEQQGSNEHETST
jgi:hypothetical protein